MTVAPDRVRPVQSVRQPAVFEGLVRQYYTQVYRVLFRLVGDRAEAEDLTLQAFWTLWQDPPARADNLGGWIYRVATRLGYNALRAAKRRTQYENASALVEPGAEPVDPARQAERSEERAHVRAALSRMRERDAQLILLRYSGLSYKEIAGALDLSPASVGTLLARAEEEFEKVYTQGGFDAPQR